MKTPVSIGTWQRSHEELRKAQDRLIHREKMVALGELCSSIAHEIKNPLVSIGGFARRLYRSIPEEAPERRYTQTIIIEVARIEKILNDVTQYTNGEHLTFKECDLKTLIEDSLSMISEDFTERHPSRQGVCGRSSRGNRR